MCAFGVWQKMQKIACKKKRQYKEKKRLKFHVILSASLTFHRVACCHGNLHAKCGIAIGAGVTDAD
jgi:hypothetical protein